MFKYLGMGIIAIAICFFINKWLGVALSLIACAYIIYSYIPAFYAAEGNKAFQAENNEKALEFYKKAYDTGRADILIKVSYAFILLKQGEFDLSESILNNVLCITKLPKDKRNIAKQYRCMVLYKLGRLDEAMGDALEIFPEYKNTSMYGMIGFFKILANEPLEKVREFCEEAYEYNSEDRDILDNLSIVCYKMGDYESAKKYSDELIKNSPKFIEAYYHGAQIAEKCGNIELAKEYLGQLDYCKRSYMTTVSEEEIENIKKRILI